MSDLRTRLPGALACLALGCAAVPAAAQTYVVQTPASPVQFVTSLGPEAPVTTLLGARATAFFADGSSASALFTPAGSNAATAIVADRFMIYAENPFDGSRSYPDFEVSNFTAATLMTGFRIDGRGDGDGRAVFDTGFIVAGSTDGSSTGIELTFNNPWPNSVKNATITLTYSNPVALTGAAPVGDVYRTLEVAMPWGFFGGLPGVQAFPAFSTAKFSTDVDTATFAAAPVPEPGAWAMLAAGLALVGAASRRRRA